MSAHHIPNVQFGHFIIGEVNPLITCLRQVLKQNLPLFFTPRHTYTDKYMCLLIISVAIIEFGDASICQCFAEALKAARLFINGSGKQHFPAFTDFGTFSHMP